MSNKNKLKEYREKLKVEEYKTSRAKSLTHTFGNGFIGFRTDAIYNPTVIWSPITSLNVEIYPYKRINAANDRLTIVEHMVTIIDDVFRNGEGDNILIHDDYDLIQSALWVEFEKNSLLDNLSEFFQVMKYDFYQLFLSPKTGKFVASWDNEKMIDIYYGNLHYEKAYAAFYETRCT